MFGGDYYIDVGIDNNDFKLILKDNSGNIIKVFDNTPEIVNDGFLCCSTFIICYSAERF